MKIRTLFERIINKEKDSDILRASATLYPDKVLIETTDRVTEGFGISSMNLTLLPLSVDSTVLGSTVKHHLVLTKSGLKIPNEYKKHYKDFLDKAGFKNGLEYHKNALQVSISQQKNQIKIIPTRNGGFTGKDKGFIEIENAVTVIAAEIDNSTLGEKIMEGWRMCECNCI